MKFKFPNSIYTNVIAAISAVAIALLVRAFVFESFSVPTKVMMPTLISGDFILVTKFDYGVKFFGFPIGPQKLPKYGDILVYRPVDDQDSYFVRRVVGLPGDLLEIVDGKIILNQVPIEVRLDTENCGLEVHPSTRYRVCLEPPLINSVRIIHVPENSLFVIGDSRSKKPGGRGWGIIDASSIVGRARKIWLSIEPLNSDSPSPIRSRFRYSRMNQSPYIK